MKNEGKQAGTGSTWLLVAIFGIAMVAATVVGYMYWSTFGGDLISEHDKWGLFGDYVGGTLNPILAFFALFALLITIHLQVRELVQTRNILKETVAASEVQTFETAFFQMLRLHHVVVNNVAVHATGTVRALAGPDTITGRPSFRRYCEVLDDYLEITVLTSDSDSDLQLANKERENIWSAWLTFFADSHDELSHYFRQLYNILLFVDSSTVIKDKKQYTRTLRAQLSLYELKLIFYNGLAKKNKPFKTLAERYALFEQISIVPFSKATHGRIKRNHYQFYDMAAYGDWTPPDPNYDDDVWVDEFEEREEEAKEFGIDTDDK